jgi:hypothetical protein
MDASLLMQTISEPRRVRVTHRTARSCTVEGAASGAVDNSANKGMKLDEGGGSSRADGIEVPKGEE